MNATLQPISDQTLGLMPIATDVTTSNGTGSQGAFNCLIGTPKQDANGNWYCDTSGVGSNQTPANGTGQTTGTTQTPATNGNNADTGSSDTRNVLIGAAVILGALYLLGGDKK